MAVRRCKKADLKRIAKATGAQFLTSLTIMEGNFLGDAVEVVQEMSSREQLAIAEFVRSLLVISRTAVLNFCPLLYAIYFNNLSIPDIYMKDSNSSRYAIWEKYTVFKVYGSLTLMGSEHVLETGNLVPVHDIVGTWNTMNLLSATACSKDHRHSRTEAQNKMLRSQWEKMKLENERLVEREP